jgi:hypothetical protein
MLISLRASVRVESPLGFKACARKLIHYAIREALNKEQSPVSSAVLARSRANRTSDGNINERGSLSCDFVCRLARRFNDCRERDLV